MTAYLWLSCVVHGYRSQATSVFRISILFERKENYLQPSSVCLCCRYGGQFTCVISNTCPYISRKCGLERQWPCARRFDLIWRCIVSIGSWPLFFFYLLLTLAQVAINWFGWYHSFVFFSGRILKSCFSLKNFPAWCVWFCSLWSCITWSKCTEH